MLLIKMHKYRIIIHNYNSICLKIQYKIICGDVKFIHILGLTTITATDIIILYRQPL